MPRHAEISNCTALPTDIMAATTHALLQAPTSAPARRGGKAAAAKGAGKAAAAAAKGAAKAPAGKTGRKAAAAAAAVVPEAPAKEVDVASEEPEEDDDVPMLASQDMSGMTRSVLLHVPLHRREPAQLKHAPCAVAATMPVDSGCLQQG